MGTIYKVRQVRVRFAGAATGNFDEKTIKGVNVIPCGGNVVITATINVIPAKAGIHTYKL